MSPDAILRRIRLALLVILALGIPGSALELLLLKHTDGPWQLLPLFLLAASALVLAWIALAPSLVGLRLWRLLMVLFVVSGLVGVLLHYRGNVEWELERMPGTGGWDLFRRAIMGATPSLAPGTMLQLGLVGLLYTYRHPIFSKSDS